MVPLLIFCLMLAVILMAFVVLAALQPSAFRITRFTMIAAPPAMVFAQVNDLHRWDLWNPWLKLDPSAQHTYTGEPAGLGASYHWKGNSKVGEGRMIVTESKPHELIRLKLEFLKPMAATNSAEFTFTPTGRGTAVEWSMTGNRNLNAKAIGLLLNLNKLIGRQFEDGLANLKTLAEALAEVQGDTTTR